MNKTTIIILSIVLLSLASVSAQWSRPSTDTLFLFYGFQAWGSPYFVNESNVITFNETKLNATIDDRAVSASDTNESVRFENLVSYACPSGEFVFNVSDNGSVQCQASAGSGDITSVQGDSYITNGADSGTVNLVFNDTKLNATIDDRDSDTTYSSLSEFTDDLGARGYTHLSNFTNDGVYITDGNTNWNNIYGLIDDGNTNWDNSYGFITDGNTGWDNSYGFITDGNSNWDNSYGFVANAYSSESNLTSLLDDNYLGLTDQRYNETTSLNNQITQQGNDNSTQDNLFYDSSEDAEFNTVNATKHHVSTIGCIRSNSTHIIIDGDGSGC